jgi:hypothetical protein
VTSKVDGEYVIGARVYLTKIDDTKPLKGANTNKFGFFSIPKVENGKYNLYVSSIAFQQYKTEITINDGDISLKIKLTTKDIKLDEVVVEASKENLPAVNRIGTFDISPTFINQMPASFGGEIDVFRSLQLLPGVQTSNELSSGLYVRGSSPDQNLTLLDGVIVYNPSHLGGFFSVFNSDALKDIRLIKGVFPAEYGGRLSSVLDMTMKEGNKEKISGDAMISLISSKLTIEGPITEDCSFMISGRRMYFDVVMWMFMDSKQFDESPTYYFYDLNAKVNYKVSDEDHIFLSGFFARDVLNAPEDMSEDFDMHWGNKVGNLRWMHVFSPTVFSNFSLIYSDYIFSTNIITDGYEDDKNAEFNSNSQINDITLRGEIQIFPHEKHTIKTGIDITNHVFDVAAIFNYEDEIIDEDEYNILGSKKLSAIELALFVQDEWAVTDELNTNLGVRLFYFNKGNYFSFEPRLSASYKVSETSSFKIGFAMANQFLHLIVRNDITLPTDLWFPSTEKVKPSKSVQGMLGFETYFFNREYYFTIEAYYKKMYNLYEYNDSVWFSMGIPLEEQFTMGDGNAYGIEIFFNKQIGKFSGWIGYTLAWTNRTFPELNYGKTFHPRYDRRHDISIVLNYKFNKKWEVGASWVYGTGQAYTMPTGIFIFDDNPLENIQVYEKYNYSERNGTRLPAFHKLDLSFMYHSTFFGLPSIWSFNLYNAYNRKNPFAWIINTEWNNSGGYYGSDKYVSQITLFPIIPSIGYSIHF